MHLLSPFAAALAERLGRAVLHSLWQGALIALVLTAALRLLRHRSAAARHAACMLARTGCALLYMGQMSEGQDRLDYLTRAVEKFSDCYYFDGCQVGGYGRYVLALTLWDRGEKDKARALFAELKTTYKDATDHRGHPMAEVAGAAEKELASR